jgi:hypothetical protein
LEVFLPDNRVGHLVRAQQEQERQDLPVNFVLKSHTDQSFTGTLKAIQETAAIHDEHGHSYRVRVTLNKSELMKELNIKEPKEGTEVVAKIACGKRSLAYCLFHELIEWVQIRLFSL